MSKEDAGALVGRARDSDLCGFEGAKNEVVHFQRRREAVVWPKRRRQKERQRKSLALRVSGDNSLRDPPVPIPNTEVKPQHADSTWLETARESRTSPDSIFGALREKRSFLYNENPRIVRGFQKAYSYESIRLTLC